MGKTQQPLRYLMDIGIVTTLGIVAGAGIMWNAMTSTHGPRENNGWIMYDAWGSPNRTKEAWLPAESSANGIEGRTILSAGREGSPSVSTAVNEQDGVCIYWRMVVESETSLSGEARYHGPESPDGPKLQFIVKGLQRDPWLRYIDTNGDGRFDVCVDIASQAECRVELLPN